MLHQTPPHRYAAACNGPAPLETMLAIWAQAQPSFSVPKNLSR
ncbi:hypothetical protein ACU8KH_00283 [Lachancea thermotolerans]